MLFDGCQTFRFVGRAGCSFLSMRSPLWAGLVAAIIGSGVACSHGAPQGGPPAADKPAGPAKQVMMSKAENTVWPDSVRVQGSLMGDEESIVAAKVAGRVKQVVVDLGSPVKKGDELALIDASDLDLRIIQAKAMLAQACAVVGSKPETPDESLDRMAAPPIVLELALNKEAESNLHRGEQLVERKAISSEDLQARRALFEVAQARLASALNAVETNIVQIRVRRAELALAEQERRDCVIVAPFDGIVEMKHVSPGMYLNVGSPTITLVRTNPLRYRAGVPERSATHVAVGQDVRIAVEGGRREVEAKVTRVSPALDSGSRALTIEADFPNADGSLRAGLFAEGVIFVDPNAKTLTIPATAVLEFAGTEKVWRVDDKGIAKEQPIDIGRRSPEQVEVLKGLKPGDVVVTSAAEGAVGKVTPLAPPAAVPPVPPLTSPRAPEARPASIAEGQAAERTNDVKGHGG